MEYKIIGDAYPIVECRLKAGEQITCKEGSVAWMTPNMEMMRYNVINGPDSSRTRLPHLICTSKGMDGMVSFMTGTYGKVLALSMEQNGIVAYQKAFLAGSVGVRSEEIDDKRIWNALSDGKIDDIQLYSGSGDLFFEIIGSPITYELVPGEVLKTDSDIFVAADQSVGIDIVPCREENGTYAATGYEKMQMKLSGPGKVYLQTRKSKI